MAYCIPKFKWNLTFSQDFATDLVEPTSKRMANLMDRQTEAKLPDIELIRAAQQGDKAAFNMLVERYTDWMHRASLRMINQPDIAKELAQEAILQAYLSLGSLRDPTRFQGWLHGILRNICHSYLRGNQSVFDSMLALVEGVADHNAGTSGEGVGGTDVDPYRLVEGWEDRHVIEKALESLSPKNQIATRLFYYEQLSLQEIAQHLGVSVNVVKARLFQARKHLQAQLQPLVGFAEVTSVLSKSRTNKKLKIQRSNVMHKIDYVHVLTMAETSSRIVYLFDQTTQHALQIWVAANEGELIANTLEGVTPFRPTAYHLFVSLLKATNLQIEAVGVVALRDNTLYATLEVRQGEQLHELDARPSDAIELALLLERPILVAPEVMQQCGRELPQPFDRAAWLQDESKRLAAQYQQIHEMEKQLMEKPTLFTLAAREVWGRVVSEAGRLNHNYLGTEHLLLGIVCVPQTPVAKLLADIGATHERISEEVDRKVGRGQTPPTGHPPMAPRLLQVFTFADEIRNEAKQVQIGVEHLLLGILREGQGMAVTILETVGVDLAMLRKNVQERAHH